MMKYTKNGISLIVLIITIIVMIILASAVIIALNNSGIINKANSAVDSTQIAMEKQVVEQAGIVAKGTNKTRWYICRRNNGKSL